MLDLIARLVDKSLVTVQTVQGEARYGLLEPLRLYALWQLAACGEAAAVEQRHTARYVGLAQQATRELSGPDKLAWLTRLDTEWRNLCAALHWVAAAGDVELELRLVTALSHYWEARGLFGEGRSWLEHAIARAR